MIPRLPRQPLLLLFCLWLCGPLEANAHVSGEVTGTVLDAETGEPVSYAYLHLEEINRTATTDRQGRFRLRNVPSGTYTLQLHRIGYVSMQHRFTIAVEENVELRLEMTPTVLSGGAVEVVAARDITIGSNLEHASIKVTGDRLRRNLDVTLSSTLSGQAGITERSMGPAPGRPVIRGLGDERVVILEDGQRTGDVSWTSADHAVTVDPAGADEIEIARGPAALEHGSGAIGGIINVVRNQIPNSVPNRVTGTLSLQGASVNRGGMGAGSVMVPIGEDLVANINLSGRLAGDTGTPSGTIPNTGIETTNNGFGAGYIRPWGYAGLSGNIYFSQYGIPPDPEGGHPAGVNMEMLKYQTEGRTELVMNHPSFSTLEARTSYIRYEHSELEAGGFVGTRYEMNTLTGSLKLRNSEWGPFERGVVGVWGEWVDYSVFGSRTPDSQNLNGALFLIQEADIGPLHLEAGLRLNHTRAEPDRERPDSFIGHVRKRSFTGLESSLSGIYDIGDGFFAGTTFMHSWRAPSLEELYSEGPHLAAYAFETGNPDLNPERGLGGELFFRYRSGSASLDVTGYYNRFTDYLHAQDTGRPSIPRADLREFRYVNTRADIYGAELSSEIQLNRRFALIGNLSWTFGDRFVSREEMDRLGLSESTQPLPMMPPVSGSLEGRYMTGNLTLGARTRAAGRQDRLSECPALADTDLLFPCETPTDGHLLFDLNAQYRFDWGGTLHTISLNALNILDTEYYNHLSLVKNLFAEPGRSLNLLYRVYF